MKDPLYLCCPSSGHLSNPEDHMNRAASSEVPYCGWALVNKASTGPKTKEQDEVYLLAAPAYDAT